MASTIGVDFKLKSVRDAELAGVLRLFRRMERIKSMLVDTGDLREYDRVEDAIAFSDSQVLLDALRREGSEFETRNLRLQFLQLKQCIERGIAQVMFVSTKHNAADILTKNLNRLPVAKHRDWILGYKNTVG